MKCVLRGVHLKIAKRHVKHHHQTSSGIELSKARSRETKGGLRVDRLESTQLDYGKRARLGSGQSDDGRERLSSGQLVMARRG